MKCLLLLLLFKDEGGMMMLIDVYCRFNRVRGMEVCVGLCGLFCVNCIIIGVVDRSNFLGYV